MDEHNELIQTIPYIAYESAQARNERTVKRLVFSLILVIVMLFASNVIWLYEWTSYDYVDEDGEDIMIDAGTRGNANYIGSDGMIFNGENSGQ